MPLETTVTAQLIFSKQWDALTHDWPNTRLYAFPPIALLPQVIRRIRETKCSLLIVTPLWRTQVWFPEMIQLLSTAPWSIPLRRDLLSKVQGKIWHPQPELLGLHVWPLNGTLVNSRRESLIQLKRLELPLHDVSKFLRGALRLNPPHPKTMPTWDLSIVLGALGALKGPPFEPLQQPA